MGCGPLIGTAVRSHLCASPVVPQQLDTLAAKCQRCKAVNHLNILLLCMYLMCPSMFLLTPTTEIYCMVLLEHIFPFGDGGREGWELLITTLSKLPGWEEPYWKSSLTNSRSGQCREGEM